MAVSMMLLPLLIGGICVLTSIVGTFFVKLGANNSIMGALYKGFIATALLSIVAVALVIWWLLGFDVEYTANDGDRPGDLHRPRPFLLRPRRPRASPA